MSERNGSSNVWIVSPRNGSDNPVTNNIDSDQSYHCPIWSSDGKRLAIFKQKRSRDANGKTPKALTIIDLETGIASNLLNSDGVIRLIGWTQDETGLVIAESEKISGLPPETFIRRIAVGRSTEPTPIRLKSAYFYNIFLSSDRRYLAFAAREQDRDDIWVMPAVGGEPRKLTNNNDSGLFFSRLAWLPDGSSIVFGKQTRFSLLSMITNID